MPAQARPKPSLFFFQHNLTCFFFQIHQERLQCSSLHVSRAFLFPCTLTSHFITTSFNLPIHLIPDIHWDKSKQIIVCVLTPHKHKMIRVHILGYPNFLPEGKKKKKEFLKVILFIIFCFPPAFPHNFSPTHHWGHNLEKTSTPYFWSSSSFLLGLYSAEA